MRRAVAILALVAAVMLPTTAQASSTCSPVRDKLHVAERHHMSAPKYESVGVLVDNATNRPTSLVVTYQASRLFSSPRTVLGGVTVDAGATYYAVVVVPRWRDTDGLVVATLGTCNTDAAVSLFALDARPMT
jgi:hypothetical protein